MKRTIAAVLAMLLVMTLSACGAKSAEEQFIAMDTVIAFRAEGKQAEKVLEEARQQIYDLEALLSRTRGESEVTLLNEAGGERVEVSATLLHLLEAAKTYCRLTGGMFDITIAPVVDAWGFTTENRQVPDANILKEKLKLVDSEKISLDDSGASLDIGQQIDLGGIGKGYVSDLMQELFERYDISGGTVSLGGNVYVKGTKEDGSLWMVGVQDPKQPESSALVGMVGLSDAFAVTSGGYQRYFEQDGTVYHHIIDPATGYPADSGLTSVTVVASAEAASAEGMAGNGTMCDALSTALFVMGEEKALEFWRESGLDFNLILVTDDDRVIVTDEIAEQFVPSQEEVYTYETVS